MNEARAAAVKYLRDEAIPCVVLGASGTCDADRPRQPGSPNDVVIGLIVVEVDCAGERK